MKLFPKNRKEKIVYTKQTNSPIQDAVLLKEIEKVKSDMDNAYENFQNVLDPDLIDCYIFESNAALKRYHFLLKQAKKIV
ncbi:YaaL family protein [Faecalimonas sp.]